MSDSDLTRVEQYVVDLFRPQDYNGRKYGVFKMGWFQTCRRNPPADNRLYWSVPTKSGHFLCELSSALIAYVDADSYVEKRVMLQLAKYEQLPRTGYVHAFVQVNPSSRPYLFPYAGPGISLYFNKDGECFVFCFGLPGIDHPAFPGFMRVYVRE